MAAWTAKIATKKVQDAAFLVNVQYTDGTNTFNEVIDMTGGTPETFSQKVQSRLDTLTVTSATAPLLPNGPYTPTPVTPTPKDNFLSAARHLQQCKKAADLGIIKTTDQVYVDALALALSLYDVTYIDAM